MTAGGKNDKTSQTTCMVKGEKTTLDIEKIREFMVVAECKDLLEAGDSLYISPSTLSRHIKSLEAELGVPLFTRTPRSLILNENGAFFLPYAAQMMKVYESFLIAYGKKNKNRKYRLYLGITPTIAQFDIEPILSNFQKEDGPIRLNITTEGQENLVESLRSCKYDFIFLRAHGRPDNELPCICCRKDVMAAVLPKDHPLANRKELHLAELKNEQFMLLKGNDHVDSIFFEACRTIGFEPKIGLSSYLESNLIDFARRGTGIALLNREHARIGGNHQVAVVPVVPQMTSEIYVMFRSETFLTNAEKYFLEHLKTLKD